MSEITELLADSALKFIFLLNIIKTLFFSIVNPVQCCLERANLAWNFWSYYLSDIWSEWCNTLCTPLHSKV